MKKTNWNGHTFMKFAGANRNHGIATLWNLKWINPTIEKYNHLSCKVCVSFSVCQMRKNVKEDTRYCQWPENRFKMDTIAGVFEGTIK